MSQKKLSEKEIKALEKRIEMWAKNIGWLFFGMSMGLIGIAAVSALILLIRIIWSAIL